MLIFEKSQQSRRATTTAPFIDPAATDNAAIKIDAKNLRTDIPVLPELSELEVVRHYTNLSRKNF